MSPQAQGQTCFLSASLLKVFSRRFQCCLFIQRKARLSVPVTLDLHMGLDVG